MKMKCKLPAVSVKLFAKAIHSLAKLGNEIYIEPLQEGLAVKTVNTSRSAYASFLFYRSLFQTYEHQSSADHDENFKCKVAVKTLLQVFKSLSSIERSVESCDIDLNDEDCRLIFKLKCRHGIIKTHHLTFQECESLQAVFAKDLSPNVIQCEHKLLNDVVSNFHTAVDEVAMSVSPCEVRFRSYFDGDDQRSLMLKTEMTLDPEEFDDFQVGVDTEITFSLKDLRAVLSFCDASATPLHIYFETGGKPLVISTEEEGNFKSHFVLATLSEDLLTSQQRPNPTTAVKNPHKRFGDSKVSSHSVAKYPKTEVKNSVPLHNAKNDLSENQTNVRLSGFNEVSILEGQGSPEIPLQMHQPLDETRNSQTSYQNESFYQGIKELFFEPSQNCHDHSLVVLAPDSDDDGS